MQTEPVAITAGVVAVVQSLIPALVLFGVIAWNEQQIAAVMLVVTNLAALVGVIVARSKVSPV